MMMISLTPALILAGLLVAAVAEIVVFDSMLDADLACDLQSFIGFLSSTNILRRQYRTEFHYTSAAKSFRLCRQEAQR